MKMLTHRSAISKAPPVSLSTVMERTSVEFDGGDPELTDLIKAAAAEIEEFANIAFLTQTIRMMIFDPEQKSGLRLPIGPVAVDHVPTVTIDGEAFTAFKFIGGLRPSIHWQACYYDLTPSRIMIEYQAGFGSSHGDIPQDLVQTIIDQTELHMARRRGVQL
ncbi:hypothetical protein [Roseovarius pacificus]|uniref:hypothetical protein n=1 Tax=Roseovarius pacificus TaxID=337701 RepID=UPI002A18DAA0|nr:hypothetical protein [Roseovarius pacificus]